MGKDKKKEEYEKTKRKDKQKIERGIKRERERACTWRKNDKDGKQEKGELKKLPRSSIGVTFGRGSPNAQIRQKEKRVEEESPVM